MQLSRPLRRLLLLGTAVVCLLGQASAFAHLALVRHATCPEHEDALVHAPAGAAAGPASRTAAPAELIAGRRVAAPAPGEGDGHDDDHCLMAAFRRSSLAAPAGDVGHVLAADRALVPPPAQVRSSRPGPVPLLLFAPKSSPPPALG